METNKLKSKFDKSKIVFWIVGFVAFLWVIIRSGTNPRRLTYPCQQAMFPLASSWLIALLALFGGSYVLKKYAKISVGGIGVVLIGYFIFIFADPAQSENFPASTQNSPMIHVDLPVWEVTNPLSKIFALNDIPLTTGSLNAGNSTVPNEYLSDPAMDTLFMLMQAKGMYLHKTTGQPGGIVGSDNIVIIKGNFQWDRECSTNTDRIKGLINQIINHPDGFTGEILVCDNTQNLGSGINSQDCNSDDPNQSISDVVNTFYAKGYPVSLRNWNTMYNTVANEYSQNDMNDGYVYESSTKISYPKFRTPSGNYVSLRYGIWNTNSSTYNHDKLCIIDFPVLKAHSQAGATIAVKNWVGVLTTAYSTERYGGFWPMHNDYFFGPFALIAKVMGVTYPRLCIVDAKWTNTRIGNDLNNLVKTNCLLASTDPVAIDWYCSKYILTPIAVDPQNTDPDSPSSDFHINLTCWADYLKNGAGLPVTKDSNEISVYNRTGLLTDISDNPAKDLGITFKCYNTGNSILKIEINTEKSQKVNIRIVDINGKIIARIVEGQHISGNYQLDYNTSNLGNGTYLINLYNGLINMTNKIIIKK